MRYRRLLVVAAMAFAFAATQAAASTPAKNKMQQASKIECLRDEDRAGARMICTGAQATAMLARSSKGVAAAPYLATIASSAGRTAKVGARHAAQFQALVRDLEAMGYRIDFMGGWRASGSCRGCDAHPAGRALDINQKRRNVVTKPLPADVDAIAARHGLCHGRIWSNPDAGHFEVASGSAAGSCRQIAGSGWPYAAVERARAGAGAR